MSAQPSLKPQDEHALKQEMSRMEYEPLLPVEKKLIGGSIALGAFLLLVFVWISQTFFPAIAH
jgi:hypothetical protein